MSSDVATFDDTTKKKDGDAGLQVSDFAKNQVDNLYELNRNLGLGLSDCILHQAEDLIPDPPTHEDVFYLLVFRTGDPEETQDLAWRISGFCANSDEYQLYYNGSLLKLHEREELRSMCWIPINVRANVNRSVKSVREEFEPHLLPSSGAILAAKYLEGEVPNIIVPGYALRNPKCNGHGKIWDRVISVSFRKGKGKIFLGKRDENFSDPSYAVPVIDDTHDIIEVHCY